MHYLFGLLFWLLIPGIFITWWSLFIGIWENHQAYIPFLIGCGAYALFTMIPNRNLSHNLRWFQTFSHELTHVVFSLLTFNRIHGFNATSHAGGHITYSGKTNMLIILSPYCIPIFTFFLLLINTIANTQTQQWLTVAIGFTYLFHLHTFGKQTRSSQPDFKIYGILPSYGFVIFMNLFCSGIVLLSITDGLTAFKNFPLAAFEQTYQLITTLEKAPNS